MPQYKNIKSNAYNTYRKVVNKYAGRKYNYADAIRQSSTARSAATAARRARAAILEVENKFFDSSFQGNLAVPTDATGLECDPATLLCLNAIPQGDTESSRDGSVVSMKHLVIDGSAKWNGVTAAGSLPIMGPVGVWIVLDTQTNGAQLNSEDVLTNPSAQNECNANMPRKMQFIRRFKVLKHFVLEPPACGLPAVDDSGAYTTTTGTTPFKCYIPLGGIKTRFASGTTTGYVGTIQDNSIHVIAASAGDSSSQVQFTYNSRIQFVG